MAGEKTAEQIQKEKDDAEIVRLAEEKRKADERVANAEKKFNEWSNEVGGIRKIGDALKTALDEAKNGLTEITALIADLKAGKSVGKQAPDGKPSGNNPGGKAEDEEPDNVEKLLTVDQRKLVEAAFNDLTPAEKYQYENDPEFRLSVFQRAQKDAPAIPASPWKTAPKKTVKPEDESGYKSILDRIFDKKRRNRFVPPGPHGGAPVLDGGSQQDEDQHQEDSRVH
jgi:hypothetical protein